MMLPPLIYHDCYSELNLPPQHRYPIGKYRALYQRLLHCGVPTSAFLAPTPVSVTALDTVHDPAYVAALCAGSLDQKALRRIGFPWSTQLIQRSLTSLGGTVLCAQLALKHGLAIHLSGGYHHAFYQEGSGFCLFNDLALAAMTIQQQGVGPILIFDLDVHQGDGTAALFADQPRIITASIHCEKNFPARKQRSDWDIGLDRDTTDAQYLEAVRQSLDNLLRWYQPELVIYDAGVDIHQDDDLGLLQISTQGVLERDKLVLNRCREAGIAVAAVIGGGYQRDLQKLTQVHLQLFKAAFANTGSPLWRKIET